MNRADPGAGVRPRKCGLPTNAYCLIVGDDKSFPAVPARSSCKWNEVVQGDRFQDMYRHTLDGCMSIDLEHIHDIQGVDTPGSPIGS